MLTTMVQRCRIIKFLSIFGSVLFLQIKKNFRTVFPIEYKRSIKNGRVKQFRFIFSPLVLCKLKSVLIESEDYRRVIYVSLLYDFVTWGTFDVSCHTSVTPITIMVVERTF
jgi:hypothetical protein